MPVSPVTLHIFNIKGKLIATWQINTRYANVQIDLANGVYLFKAGKQITRVPMM
ncbi:MAG: T9SS type A sorting domain-containing protein [Fibromonadales bacterium]|nr:T9SS type A sorting domain-containing protein [Fibromonadales bacterium]